ncbi:uncharacterized protein LOC113214941 [Frankliniella occidentalis]|uniref:Uncharacterized protein LOC113214941 n=1 Tax=Frankliniella occidentalis TaxID=133901 RepID=A0A6J1T9K8_FRAOC|nr:uncharacterized protein LOC113214941 [Frankliniella occidentalis]
MATTCAPCGKTVKNSEKSIICAGKCRRLFHQTCLKLSDDNYKKYCSDNAQKWLCRREDCVDAPNLKDLVAVLTKKIDDSTTSLKKEIADIIASQTFISEQYENLKSELSELKERVNDVEAREAPTMEFKTELAEIQQYQRRNNLIISGIPETTNEDVFQRLFDMAAALKVDLLASDIDAAHRIGKKTDTRPRRVIVKLTNRWKKEQLLTANRWFGKTNKRTLLTSDINYMGSPTKIYIDEHLIPMMDGLAKKCRDLKHQDKIVSTFVRDCKIVVKVKKEDRPTHIRSEDDYYKLLLSLQ